MAAEFETPQVSHVYNLIWMNGPSSNKRDQPTKGAAYLKTHTSVLWCLRSNLKTSQVCLPLLQVFLQRDEMFNFLPNLFFDTCWVDHLSVFCAEVETCCEIAENDPPLNNPIWVMEDTICILSLTGPPLALSVFISRQIQKQLRNTKILTSPPPLTAECIYIQVFHFS